MNTAQKVVGWVGLVVFVWMSLYPPYVHQRGEPLKEIFAGYHFIGSSPPPFQSGRQPYFVVDMRRISVQWVALLVLVGGSIYLLKSEED